MLAEPGALSPVDHWLLPQADWGLQLIRRKGEEKEEVLRLQTMWKGCRELARDLHRVQVFPHKQDFLAQRIPLDLLREQGCQGLENPNLPVAIEKWRSLPRSRG